MAKKINIPKDNNIVRVPLEEAMPENYLPYAVEVAKDRALPDVRDGLKPVHRRILYGAYMLKAFPDKPYYKSARIVGDILGKYHPHGDSSVYDAMVILAQDFNTRKPLIQGHGNYGSIDGDSAAAMRYTEARLSPIAGEMLRDLDKGVVEMVMNYSETETEPKVLPARYPNLLVNGTFGIAVGLATNIPPHNLNEVIDGLLAYADKQDITTEELMEYIKGPDLPTGGILIGKKPLLSAYETGAGKVTLRARVEFETLDNGRMAIVIKEFPYRKNKAKLLQFISDMTGDKKHMKALELIADIRDESDRTGIRAVIELKKNADAAMAGKVLNYLYKNTDLQSNLSFNMVALANGKPETLGLKSILMHYLNHQKDVVKRRTEMELSIAEKRFHIVEGFIKAIDIMDAIIETIRASKSKKDAQTNLISNFGFTEAQADAILELMLYRLTGLEIKVFEKEYKELEKAISKLQKILSDEKELLKVIKTEIKEIKDKYGDPRRTEIIEDENKAKIDIDELVIVEDVVITASKDGYIKRVPQKYYNRFNAEVDQIEYREGDFNQFLIQANTKNSLMIFSNKGNMYQMKVNDIPEYKWKDKGEKLDELVRTLDLKEEKPVFIHPLSEEDENKNILMITNKGVIKKTALKQLISNYTKIQAIKLKKDEQLIYINIDKDDSKQRYLKMTTDFGLQVILKEPQIEVTDKSVQGIQAARIKDECYIESIEYINQEASGNFTIGISPKGVFKAFKSSGEKSVRKVTTNGDEKLLIFTDDGKVHIIDAFMLQNINDKEIGLASLSDFDDRSNKVIEMASIKNFDDNKEIFFFTNSGMVKKTLLKEIEGNYTSTSVYKFKNEKDKLVNVVVVIDGAYAIIITNRAMGIRFEVDSVNPMGKSASGVTAISLKEDDELSFATVVSESDILERDKLMLMTDKKEKKTVNISDVRLQNRATRGTNLMIFSTDDFIKEVKLIK